MSSITGSAAPDESVSAAAIESHQDDGRAEFQIGKPVELCVHQEDPLVRRSKRLGDGMFARVDGMVERVEHAPFREEIPAPVAEPRVGGSVLDGQHFGEAVDFLASVPFARR